MAQITLLQAARWCGGQIDPKYAQVTFDGANNDSRLLQPGQLFLALQGNRDGHDFIPAALRQGAAAVLCTHCDGDYPAIVVEDTRLALGQIARGLRQHIGMKVVGVTGSVGKSTTKEMIAAVLARKYRVDKTPANHNNDIGMPMSLLGMGADTQVAVVEMGMNHAREIAYLTSIALPDVAVIVNIGTMHIEHLGSREGILRAKLEIREGMGPDGILILNGDDDMLWGVRERDIPARYFGAHNPACDVCASDIAEVDGNLRFTVRAGNDVLPVALPVEGAHYGSDALAAVAVGLALDVPAEEISAALASFRNMKGRQEIFEAKGCTIIKDCYNAGPESMAAALAVLGKKPGRRVAVLGDMLELGTRAPAEHYRVGRIAAETADIVLACGQYGDRVISGALTGGMSDRSAKSFPDLEGLTAALRCMAQTGDVLLFKGSHGMHMERALDEFLKEET